MVGTGALSSHTMMGKRNHTPFLYPEHAFSLSLPGQSALFVPNIPRQRAAFAQMIRGPWDREITWWPLGIYRKLLTLHTITTTDSFFFLTIVGDRKSWPQDETKRKYCTSAVTWKLLDRASA